MSEYEETKLKEFIINTIDPEKFERKQSDIQPFECWLVEDDAEYATVEELANKQDVTDNSLTTTDKTIVGAINELNAKPAGLPTYIEATETLRFGE